MSEDFSKGILFSVAGLVVGGVLGALGGFLADAGKVSLPVIAGIFGFITYLVALICAIMGLITNGVGGLIVGLILGAVVGGVLDYINLIPVNLVGTWVGGSVVGVVAGLIGALMAPPESKLGKGKGR